MTVLKRKIAKDIGWTPARRAAQSARLRASRIWLKSTGPRTRDGKSRASANSLKRGIYTKQARQVRQSLTQINAALRLHRAFLQHLNYALRHGLDDADAAAHAFLIYLADTASAAMDAAFGNYHALEGDDFLPQPL